MQIGIIQENKPDSTNSIVSLNREWRTQRNLMNPNPNETTLPRREKKSSLFLPLAQQEQETNTDTDKTKMNFNFKGEVQTGTTIQNPSPSKHNIDSATTHQLYPIGLCQVFTSKNRHRAGESKVTHEAHAQVAYSSQKAGLEQ